MAGRGPAAGGDRRTAEGTRTAGDAWDTRQARGVRDLGEASGPWSTSDDLPGIGLTGTDTGTQGPDGSGSCSGERQDGAGLGARPRDEALVRIHDAAGRPRGLGFVADHHGTVVTSHEVVDGSAGLVLYSAEGDRSCAVDTTAVTLLPALDLALVRTAGLGVEPLPVTVREQIETGAYVRIAAGGWREARVLGAVAVTYTATDRLHLLDGALELAIGTAGRDALRLGGGAAGGPVLDAGTGAVVGVLGAALQSGHRDAVFAVPLLPQAGGRAWAGVTGVPSDGALAELLAENAATVPAYGADLNLAGVLELTATSVGQDGPAGAPAGHVGREGAGGAGAVAPVERASTAREFSAFAESRASVLGLVGRPGSGRTTELAALAARRSRGPQPAPTLWLRGADLRHDDTSVADAARRALNRAARIVAASVSVSGSASVWASVSVSAPAAGQYSADPGILGDTSPERLAQLARATGRPLLLLLDSPEEMPPSSPTASRSGPRARRSGCGRRGLGWWWRAGRSTGRGLVPSSRRSCCTAPVSGRSAGPPGGFRRAYGSTTSPLTRPTGPAPATASRTAFSPHPMPDTPSRSASSPRCAPPCPTPPPSRSTATTSSPPTSTSCACASPSA